MELHVFIDGASSGNPGDSGAAFIVKDGRGQEILRGAKYLGVMTNNMAEYEALIMALEKVAPLGAEKVFVYTDSKLLLNQLTGKFRVRDEKLKERFERAKIHLKNIPLFELKFIFGRENKEVDRLAKMASRRDKRVVAGLKA